ncbi:hypothetical protein T265_03375 [Opisthorchis viverrini]|uniref:Homeobox domain-containing protein n=1 Tax=Opisthorchis viverrini TaxID=6198 RepID=A0A075AHL8_OPIVI|nr:hypothetical protein T265_03375 [Opisthorchis viverrini]KER30109.1 hypothetical protein T265_03375 [Opisthorchis viverrini]
MRKMNRKLETNRKLAILATVYPKAGQYLRFISSGMSCAHCFQPQQLFTIDAILASECKSDKIPNKEVRQHLELCPSVCNELPINPDVSSHLHPVSSYWSQQISKSLPTDLEVKAAVNEYTLICKLIWFFERLIWNPAESLICDVLRQLNVLRQVSSCFSCYDIRGIAIHVYICNVLLMRLLKIRRQPTTGFALFGARQLGTVPGFPSTLFTPPTSPADIGSYDKGDSLPRLHTLKSVKSRSPRIPFTKIQVDALETKFQQTHYLSGMEVYQLSSKLSLAENRDVLGQLNVLHQAASYLSWYDIRVITKHFINVAENSSTAHDRFRSS